MNDYRTPLPMSISLLGLCATIACGEVEPEFRKSESALRAAVARKYLVTDLAGNPLVMESRYLEVTDTHVLWRARVAGNTYELLGETFVDHTRFLVTSQETSEDLVVEVVDGEIRLESADAAGRVLGVAYAEEMLPAEAPPALGTQDLHLLNGYIEHYLPTLHPTLAAVAFVGFPTVFDHLLGEQAHGGDQEVDSYAAKGFLKKVGAALGKIFGGKDLCLNISKASCVDSNGNRASAACGGCKVASCQIVNQPDGQWACQCGCE